MLSEKNIRSVLVLGGTGKTGRYVVREALGQGLRVTALVRQPQKLERIVSHPNLEILKGDVLNYPDVYNAVQGNDAIVSALGRDGRHVSVLTRGTAHILRAIGHSSVRKLVCLSAIGAGSTRELVVRPWRHMISWGGQGALVAAQTDLELQLYRSAVDFTLVMAGRLADGLTDGNPVGYSSAQAPCVGILPPKLSRQSVARYMLAQLKTETWRRKTVCLFNED